MKGLSYSLGGEGDTNMYLAFYGIIYNQESISKLVEIQILAPKIFHAATAFFSLPKLHFNPTSSLKASFNLERYL
jgi:hypothetical protein